MRSLIASTSGFNGMLCFLAISEVIAFGLRVPSALKASSTAVSKGVLGVAVAGAGCFAASFFCFFATLCASSSNELASSSLNPKSATALLSATSSPTIPAKLLTTASR